MRSLLLVALILAFVPSVALAQSVSPRDMAIADAAIAGTPCAGHVRVTWDPTLAVRKAAGAANALENPDGTLTLISCDVSLEPVEWAQATPEQRCLVVVHEWRHLALHTHSEGGVMDVPTGKRWWSACDALVPLGDRVTGLVLSRIPRGWSVSCGPRRANVVHCRGEFGRHVRRYRVRVIGAALAIVRTT